MFRVLLLKMSHVRFAAKVADAETALLYRELEEEIYMEYPPITNDIGKDHCIILGKCIHILVQAARQFNAVWKFQ